jgi:hypothetical protein
MAKRKPVRRRDSAKSQTTRDKQILADLDYIAAGGWHIPVNNVIYHLTAFRGQWAATAEELLRLMTGSKNLEPSEEKQVLLQIRGLLANVKNRPKRDLSKKRQDELRLSVNEALERTLQGLRLVEETIKQEDKRDRRLKKNTALANGVVEFPLGVRAIRDEFRPPWQFADKHMKGIEQRIVQLVCERNGACPLADLAIDPAIEWDMPCDGVFNTTSRRINLKLKKLGWKLYRGQNAAKFAKIPIGRK